MRKLPFPGYSWPLTQHAVGFSAHTIYSLLQCAAPFVGETTDYGQKITKLMVEADLLTPNERDGKFDAWRDYQQLLAEIGLIYSTKKTPNRKLLLTELGNRFLAGELGFAELMGMQALKYQYPNGQKSPLSPEVKKQLTAAGESAPETLTELHATKGVLIKPATLILRILIELNDSGYEPTINEAECSYALMPCATNAEWGVAYAEIVRFRLSKKDPIKRDDKRIQRNIQDWFRLIACTDLFEYAPNSNRRAVTLTKYAISELTRLKELLHHLETPEMFWIPTGFDSKNLLSWFDWYGSMKSVDQLILQKELTDQYVEKNYIGGVDDAESVTATSTSAEIKLTPIDLEKLGNDSGFTPNTDIKKLVESIRKGAEKRHAKAIVHDQIVKSLAIRFVKAGAAVTADRDSIDLFVRWPTGAATIFEVKTMTSRNFSERLRLAIGQIQEYGYRHFLKHGENVDLAVAIDSKYPGEGWQIDFLNNRLGIGLVCEPQLKYQAYVPSGLKSASYWRE